MTADVTTSPETIARQFAAAIRHEPGVERLWLHSQREYLELWLMTAPVDIDAERRLFEQWAELVASHPQANVRLHVLNPSFIDDGVNLTDYVPASAVPIALRT